MVWNITISSMTYRLQIVVSWSWGVDWPTFYNLSFSSTRQCEGMCLGWNIEVYANVGLMSQDVFSDWQWQRWQSEAAGDWLTIYGILVSLCFRGYPLILGDVPLILGDCPLISGDCPLRSGESPLRLGEKISTKLWFSKSNLCQEFKNTHRSYNLKSEFQYSNR